MIKEFSKPTKFILLFLSLATVWILSGIFSKDDNSEKAEQKQIVSKVRVVESTAKDKIGEIAINGITRASRIVELKSETMGKVTAILAKEGSLLKSGDGIVKLDYRDRVERLNQAKATLSQKLTQLNAAEKLFSKGLQSEVSLSAAKAEYEMAKASLKDSELEIQHITIKAPFDGKLEKTSVEVGDFVQVGQMVGKFIDNDPFLVVAQINENQIGEIVLGKEAICKTVSGQIYKGVVTYIASVADVRTRTFNIEVEVANTDGTLKDGLTTLVKIPTSTTKAHLISPAFYSLNEEGVVGVKTINENNIVKFNKIEIIGDGHEGNWIKGLPEKATIISTGQEFVKNGEKVEPIKESVY